MRTAPIILPLLLTIVLAFAAPQAHALALITINDVRVYDANNYSFSPFGIFHPQSYEPLQFYVEVGSNESLQKRYRLRFFVMYDPTDPTETITFIESPFYIEPQGYNVHRFSITPWKSGPLFWWLQLSDDNWHLLDEVNGTVNILPGSFDELNVTLSNQATNLFNQASDNLASLNNTVQAQESQIEEMNVIIENQTSRIEALQYQLFPAYLLGGLGLLLGCFAIYRFSRWQNRQKQNNPSL
jgi:hypothetical protein